MSLLTTVVVDFFIHISLSPTIPFVSRASMLPVHRVTYSLSLAARDPFNYHTLALIWDTRSHVPVSRVNSFVHHAHSVKIGPITQD